MARIRTIKPEARTDETVASWPREVRLAWTYLWCSLDDAGRARDNVALLVAEMFPLDKDVTEKRLDGWLDLMASTPGESGEAPLCRYEVDGRRYLHAVRWRHQKISHPTVSRLPQCGLTHRSASPPGTPPEKLRRPPVLAPEPSSLAGAGARSRIRDQGIKGSVKKAGGLRLIDGLDISKICKALDCPPQWAESVAVDVLGRSASLPASPTGYVLTAIENDPQRYRMPEPPRCYLHNIPGCQECADDTGEVLS